MLPDLVLGEMGFDLERGELSSSVTSTMEETGSMEISITESSSEQTVRTGIMNTCWDYLWVTPELMNEAEYLLSHSALSD